MSTRFLSFKMVTETPDYSSCVVEQPQRLSKERNANSLGPLTFDYGLQSMNHFYRGNYSVVGRQKMVFRFGDVEVTPTIERIKDYFDSIKKCGKRNKYPDHHIKIPERPTSAKLKNILLLVNADWFMLKIYH